MRNFFLFLVCISFSFFAASCKKQSSDRIYFNDNFYYLNVGEHSTVYDAINDYSSFKKFNINTKNNIAKVTGIDGHYMWLRVEFTIPENLRNRELGLFIEYLHFSDEVYVNGNFAGGYGAFPPNERSPLFDSHFYHLPKNFLKQLGTNTILIKVWSHGRSHISQNLFIGTYSDIRNMADKNSFFNSKIYMIFEGILLCSTVLFLLMYMWQRDEKYYLPFALFNIATMFFLTPFFINNIPLYTKFDIPYATFIKITFCFGIYLMIFFISCFMIKYLQVDEKKPLKIIRFAILFVSILETIFASDYNTLMKITPFILSLLIVQAGIAHYYLIQCIIKKSTRHHAISLLLCLAPTLIGIVIDLAVRLATDIHSNNYATIFTLQLTILAFIFMLTIKFTKAMSQNAYLNKNLKQEVANQTKEISVANEKLEQEIWRANTDLEMASIVQKKFFPYPSINFKGWDIAICYEAAAKVSGDLYDYYHDGSKLDGFSLFDVSGHGIASSLITMLSKGIIFQEFKRAKEKFRLLSEALYRINDEILEAKGEIENYLTGLLFRFSEFDPNDICRVEMSNAGHPNPCFYSAKDDLVSEIIRDDTQEQYGAIGIKGIPVCFPNIVFFMGVGDVLVIFTDGLTETMNKNKEEFGKERIMQILRSSAPKPAQSILEDIVDELYLFTNGEKREDDLSIIVLKRTNSKGYLDYLDAISDVEDVEEL
ncbi:MAG: SpoIIE family protein phosphatase [Treponema sp.]|nr:SpoIIE family protein phosphatase [Treponema sp.]